MINIEDQINQCIHLVKEIFYDDLLAVYLYGSPLLGGLQKYSDIDLFVIINRSSTLEEKKQLATALLTISGNLPIDMMVVREVDINPWHYPPPFDFHYGEWLRHLFENGNFEPWQYKMASHLAITIPQILLSNKVLFGASPHDLLPNVPFEDFVAAIENELQSLMIAMQSEDWDKSNILLTLARFLRNIETHTFCSKIAAADWVMSHLPDEYQPVIKKAKAISEGKEEDWGDIQALAKPCAEFLLTEIRRRIQ